MTSPGNPCRSIARGPGKIVADETTSDARRRDKKQREARRGEGQTHARTAGSRSRRSDILERAADLIGRKGFAGMSARNLAGALEFSKANFFYHHLRDVLRAHAMAPPPGRILDRDDLAATPGDRVRRDVKPPERR
jgi:hypothetical protein